MPISPTMLVGATFADCAAVRAV